MNKLILICLLFVIPTAFATTCANSDFADKVGFDALTSSVTSSSLSYCKGLEGENLCCSVDTINSLQTVIDTLVRETVLEAAARDSYLLAARAAVSSALPAFKTLQASAKSAVSKLQAAIAQSANADYSAFGSKLTNAGLISISDDAEEALKAEDDWSKYQAARATCANKVFEAQATVLCLVCRVDPDDYATFASGQLSYATAYETALSTACYNYLSTYAPAQNMITYSYLGLENLAALNTLVASVDADITKATSANLATLTTLTTLTPPTEDSQEVPAELTGCNSATDCEYTYTTLLTNGLAVVSEYLANGGSITPSDSSSRLLGEARTLAAVSDPTDDANASGVTVDFPADVIAAASAWRQGGLMTCVVALVAMLLF